MRDLRKPYTRDFSPWFYQKIIDKKVEKALYFHGGLGLDLKLVDIFAIDDVLKKAYREHEKIGQMIIKKDWGHLIFCIPITKSCYNEIEEIILNPERVHGDVDGYLNILDIKYDDWIYFTHVDCLIKTNECHYYLVTGGGHKRSIEEYNKTSNLYEKQMRELRKKCREQEQERIITIEYYEPVLRKIKLRKKM